jgi:hypothetical protein
MTSPTTTHARKIVNGVRDDPDLRREVLRLIDANQELYSELFRHFAISKAGYELFGEYLEEVEWWLASRDADPLLFPNLVRDGDASDAPTLLASLKRLRSAELRPSGGGPED